MKLLTILFVLFVKVGFSQQLFSKVYSDSPGVSASAMLKTSDGGLIIGGHTTNSAVIKLDSLGNVEWTKSYMASSYNNFTSVVETYDSGFVFSGTYRTSGSPAGIYLLKIDKYGNLIRQTSILESESCYAYSINKTMDHGFIIAGRKDDAGDPLVGNPFLLKVDSLFNVVWFKTSAWAIFNLVARELPDSSIIVGASNQNPYLSYSSSFIYKVDKNGNFISGNNYFIISRQMIQDLLFLPGGILTYLITDSTAILMKTQYDGTILWSKSYSTQISLSGTFAFKKNRPLKKLSDHNIVFAPNTGHSRDFTEVMKSDTNGNVIWVRSIGNCIYQVEEADDHGLYFLGFRDSYGIFSLVKADSLGNSLYCNSQISPPVPIPNVMTDTVFNMTLSDGTFFIQPVPTFLDSVTVTVADLCTSTIGVDEISVTSSVLIYPNPVRSELHVQTKFLNEKIELSIRDMLGREVEHETLYADQNGEMVLSPDLSNGIYTVVADCNGRRATGKFVINK